MKPLQALFLLMAFPMVSFAQNFRPAPPDTAKLKLVEEILDHSESIGYIYLKTYYEIRSLKDSLEYFEGEPTALCAFYQRFSFGIEYSVYHCTEAGGISERIAFPKMSPSDMRRFIELLFYDPANSWTSDRRYEPDGAGCYYTIIQTDTQSIIDIYCGC